MTTLNVNGTVHEVDAEPDTPLLWVLRDELGLTGTKFGCGMAQCGACTVHVDGQPMRSCVTPVAAVGGSEMTTIEGLTGEVGRGGADRVAAARSAQCGYCQSGPDDDRGGAAGGEPEARATPTSTARWSATSAAAPPISASAPPCTRRPELLEA